MGRPVGTADLKLLMQVSAGFSPSTSGQYYVDGVGYATIQAILTGSLVLPGLLTLLFAAKLCATSISLGSGASGGIFSPSLATGPSPA